MSKGRTKEVVTLHAIQGVAATEANIIMGMCPRNGVIKSVRAGQRTVTDQADEFMDIDVTKGGTNVLSSAIRLDNSNTTRADEEGTIDAAQAQVAEGDWFEADLTYTPGLAAKPMLDTLVTVEIEVD